MIQVQGLTKHFGTVTAVEGIDFQVKTGEIFGFLGPNGAGKTTTLNMLTGLARPDTGTIQIGGHDVVRHPKPAQRLMGIVPDESNLYPELTGFENLCFCGALYGMRQAEREGRASELLNVFGLADAAARRFAGYSKGMKRKLTIAAALIHRPSLLFLDEPTTGIDVAAARQIRELIVNLRCAGTTIFLTTHYIEEAERLCDRVAFLVSGRIVRTDTIAALLQYASGSHVMQVAVATRARELGRAVDAAFPLLKCQVSSDTVFRVEASEPVRVGDLIRFLEDQGAEVMEARKVHPSLEEVFVRVTGIDASAVRKEKEKAGQGA